METAIMTVQKNKTISGWVAEYGRRLVRFVQSRVSDAEAAEDLVQDVWYQLVRLDDIDSIEQIGSWLFTAARNRIVNYYKKRRDVSFSNLEAQPGGGDDANPDEDDLRLDPWLEQHLPDTILESTELWEQLQAALELLPAEQREVFVANELYDISFRELSEQTGVPLNTLLSRKRYAVLSLRKTLQQAFNNL